MQDTDLFFRKPWVLNPEKATVAYLAERQPGVPGLGLSAQNPPKLPAGSDKRQAGNTVVWAEAVQFYVRRTKALRLSWRNH